VYDQVSGHCAGNAGERDPACGQRRQRCARRAEDAEREREIARVGVARAGDDDVESLVRRELADEADADRGRRDAERRFRVRPHLDVHAGEMPREARGGVVRGRDRARAVRERAAERVAPRRDAERPLRGAPREARIAAGFVGLSAVAAFAAVEVVARTVRIGVVQRDVEPDAERGGDRQHVLRQAVDVMQVDTAHAERAQQRDERRAILRQLEREVDGVVVARPGEPHFAAASRAEPQDLGAIGERRDQLAHVAAHAARPAVRHDEDAATRRLREPGERGEDVRRQGKGEGARTAGAVAKAGLYRGGRRRPFGPGPLRSPERRARACAAERPREVR